MNRRAGCLHLIVLASVLMGCAGKARMRLPENVESPLVPVMGNGIAGNTMSQWLDYTPGMNTSAILPPAAEDCAMIYDPLAHRIVLFGGKNDEDKNTNEVWSLDLARNAWQKIEIEGESPPPSEDHAVIYDPIGHRMILHGGEDGPTWNNTWSLDLKTHRWRNITQPASPAREDHTAIFDSHRKRLVIFGGRENDDKKIHEAWAYDLDPSSPTFEKWQSLTAGDKHPEGRTDHVAVFDSLKNRMIIYGGWDDEARDYLDDTWAFSFAASSDKTSPWMQIKTKKSCPPKRRHAVGVYDSFRNWFIICGGFGKEGYLNDVWAFDLTMDVWINITPGPRPRIDHQAIYDPRSQRLILYGGDARLREKFHDLWELQIRPGLPFDSLKGKALGRVVDK